MARSKFRALWLELIDRSCGLPNYETYLQHRQQQHPGEPVLDRKSFFLEAQAARYQGSKGKVRCC